MSEESVLVTGGAGFIGSYVVQRLTQLGYQVIVYDDRELRADMRWLLRNEQTSIVYERGAIQDEARLREVIEFYRPTNVIHAAAISNPVYLSEHPRKAIEVNLGSTLNVLELSRKLSVRRVIFFSSIAVLPRIQHEPIPTSHPVILADQGPGGSFYGASKLAGEAFCFSYVQSYASDVIILRPSAVYGFGMGYPIYIKPIVENAVLGRPTLFDHGREFPRDYTHVRDVVQMTVAALRLPPESVKDRLFYAASGEPLVTVGELVAMVKAQIPGAEITVESGLSVADMIEIAYRGVLDITNAREQLGYVPQFTSLAEGIAEYITLFREFIEFHQD